MAAALFWSSLALVAYAYGGYMVVLVGCDAVAALRANARWLSSDGDRRRAGSVDDWPFVTVLVAAYNEEACLKEKIENTLALDYPPDRLEILIGSDGSTDRTDGIVEELARPNVRLSRAPRVGKAAVLNRLVREAKGTRLLFTDANTRLAPDVLRRLVERMRGGEVGGACGRLRLVTPSGGAPAEGLYWRYENLLKLYESRRGALMGANGGVYLLRRSEWRELQPDTIVDDFLVTMRVLLAGRKLTYVPEAVAVEETAADLQGERVRRVRIAAGNFQSLRELWPLLFRPSFVSFAFWSHKLLRWVAPGILVVLLAANVTLAARPLYACLLGLQLAFYLAALLLPSGKGAVGRIVHFARYFVEMNAAMMLGFVKFARGRQASTWQRTGRPPTRRAA